MNKLFITKYTKKLTQYHWSNPMIDYLKKFKSDEMRDFGINLNTLFTDLLQLEEGADLVAELGKIAVEEFDK